jgi:aryl-alcohol dehydrogenase-like predicted oxidoreductase
MSVLTMRAADLPSGETIPVLGMGTWHLAEGRHPPEVELDALRTGLDLGMTLIDTAELYGGGATESLVGRAIAGRRDEVVLATKFGNLSHANGGVRQLDSSPATIRTAVEGSLKSRAAPAGESRIGLKMVRGHP